MDCSNWLVVLSKVKKLRVARRVRKADGLCGGRGLVIVPPAAVYLEVERPPQQFCPGYWGFWGFFTPSTFSRYDKVRTGMPSFLAASARFQPAAASASCCIPSPAP